MPACTATTASRPCAASTATEEATYDFSTCDFDRDLHVDWWVRGDQERSARAGRAVEAALRRFARARVGEAGASEGLASMTAADVAEATISSGTYGADARAALKARTRRVGENWRAIAEAEDAYAMRARRGVEDGYAAEAAEAAETRWSIGRVGAVGVGAVLGGAALFLSGGMAAPAVASALGGLGALGAGAAGAMSALGGAGVIFGATGAGMAGFAIARRTSRELEQFQFIPLRGAGRGFAVHVFIPGFLRDGEDLLTTWGGEGNQYVVVVSEPGALGLSLGRDSEGNIYVEPFDAEAVSVGSKAKDAGVIAGSVLVSYRSLDPSFQKSASTRYVLSKNRDPVRMLTEIEDLPRPLELRLALPNQDEELNEKIGAMVDDMRDVVTENTLEDSVNSPELDLIRQEKKRSHSTGEQYVLNWEPTTLSQLGAAMQFLGGKYAIKMAAPQVIAKTALASIASAFAWPVTLLSVASYLDNPWQLARNKADIVGGEIARALLSQYHGRRPVTLVAYSAGAYVVQSTLMKLHEAGDKGQDIVDSVVLISAPLSNSRETWAPMREVVSGRFINVYVPDDWMLMFFYKLQSVDTTLGLAGLQPVAHEHIENVALPGLKHAKIPDNMADILAYLGVEDEIK